MFRVREVIRSLYLSCALFLLSNVASAQQGAPGGEWPVIGGDAGHSKYSALDQINRDNARRLSIAWTWTSVDSEIQKTNPDSPQIRNATYFELTPIMIGGVLYGSTCLGQAFALDAGTGKTIWSFSSGAYKNGRPPNLGYISRGVAYREVDGAGRVFFVTSDSYLYALDAKTGRPMAAFADNGRADLIADVPRARRGPAYGHPSAPVVCGDVVIVGSSISDGPTMKEGVPGRVKAFDLRSGALRWTFNCIPAEGDPATQSWEADAWRYTGGANVWTNMSADEELGYVYLPTSTPTNDFYGGHRLGDGLYAESLVCLEAATGRRVWHYQIVHHGLWDYDLPCAPNLVDIAVNGKTIKAVAQATKHGFVFVFDRATGAPVWPIEERPVPQSAVPGEKTSATQPFPTKPAAFTKQGVNTDDLIDYTPELKAKALKIAEGLNFGPLFTPPTHDKPLLEVPGYGGGANWPGCAFDPESGLFYIPSMNWPSLLFVAPPDAARSNFRYTRARGDMEGPEGLPLLKGPYAEIVAMDLSRGEIAWRKVNGGEAFKAHPALAGHAIPELGSNARAAALVTKTLLFVTEGSGRSGSASGGGTRLRMIDKKTGDEVAGFDFLDQPTGVPMTYLWKGRQFIVVPIGSNPAQLVALALPAGR
jgi:quinoprotein glucose dehydrogenase